MVETHSPVSRLLSHAAPPSPSLWATPTGRDFMLRAIQRLLGSRRADQVPLSLAVQLLLVGGKLDLDVLSLLRGKKLEGDPEVGEQLLSAFAYQQRAKWTSAGGEAYVHAAALLLTAVESDLQRVSRGWCRWVHRVGNIHGL